MFGDLEMVMRGFSNGIPGSDESCIEMKSSTKISRSIRTPRR